MPTNRRKIVRTGKIEISEDQIDHLNRGFTFLSYCEPWFGKMGYPFQDDRHRRQLWEKYKIKILADHEKEKRPSAWWDYTEPEKKRRIVSGNPDFALWDLGLYFGKARVSEVGPHEDGYPVYETQAVALDKEAVV